MRYSRFLIIALLIFSNVLFAQEKKTVSLEDVWKNYTFYPKSVYGINWMKDGRFYTSLDQGKIVKYDITTGKPVATLFESDKIQVVNYSFNATEDKILLQTEVEKIYRRSYKAQYYVYDMNSKALNALSKDGKQSYATFSPDGKKIAFVRDNNLFYVNVENQNGAFETLALTTNGEKNKIIHGSTDWVYEEEFSFVKAFFWSPDSQKLAYYTFDESEVKEYNMQVWNGLYPEDYRFKYPKAGESNSKVSISVYHLDINPDNSSKKNVVVDLGAETDVYLPRIQWTKDANTLSIRKMNRLQNELELLHANAKTGKTTSILYEKSDTYIDLDFTDDLTYLADGKHFIHSSEQDAYKHLYLYTVEGKRVRQITKGAWEVDHVAGIDEGKHLIYFTSTKSSPLGRQLYSINFKGKQLKQLSEEAGTHDIDMSPDCQFYIDTYSAANLPYVVSLHEAHTGKTIKVLEDNHELKAQIQEYQISPKTFFDFTTNYGVKLNGWMIKPQNFDPAKKYPVLMFQYGGPGSQEVLNKWNAFDYFWYQHLASQGYLIACVDNRGTGGRGAAFKKATYAQLGKLEVEDQIAANRYLANLPYVDSDRIGIWGWSYGGYMSSLCILLGADDFKMAIAVAPVSTWRFYDTIYTERYLKRPQDNASGYDQYSPIMHVSKLKGKYLLIHGTGDDNVHFQNAVELQNALIKANKQFDSFYYPNRNHGIYGGNTRLHLYQMMTRYLQENL